MISGEAGELVQVVVTSLFAIAFAAWAKRLDKALDLLEKIQASMFKQAIRTERRLVRLESKNQIHHHDEDEGDGGDDA